MTTFTVKIDVDYTAYREEGNRIDWLAVASDLRRIARRISEEGSGKEKHHMQDINGNTSVEYGIEEYKE